MFFSDQYKPRLQLEDYLKTKKDNFLSFDYIIDHDDLMESIESMLFWINHDYIFTTYDR